MFTLLGSSKCEVLSVLDSKDAFHSLRLNENSETYCGILPFFGNTSYLYQRMTMGLNLSPAIQQSYINTIQDCLQSRNYCEEIMDDILLLTPQNNTSGRIRRFTESIVKEWTENISNEVPTVQDRITVYG